MNPVRGKHRLFAKQKLSLRRKEQDNGVSAPAFPSNGMNAAKAGNSEPPIVLIFDVRVPKRHVLRHVKPRLVDSRGRPMAMYCFLTDRMALVRGRNERCDTLGDRELSGEVLARYRQHWQKKICFFCTADRGFYQQVPSSVRNQLIVFLPIPLWGKEHFTTDETIAVLIKSIVPLVRKAFFRLKKGKRKTVSFCWRRIRTTGNW